MNRHEQAWIVDDDRSIRWVLERALQRAGIEVRAFKSAEKVLKALQTDHPNVLITDVRMPGMDGLQLLERVQAKQPHLPVIIMTAYSDLESTVSAYQGGAFEYLPKPFDVDEAVDLAHRACETYIKNQADTQVDTTTDAKRGDMIGESTAMQGVFRAIGRLVHSSITVLITGESGTGKELIAHALHTHSPRANKPFIALNTAAIPADLLESELFGHEKGAFTGAHALRKGRFEQASGGTLFLDEIGDMPAELQTRLLRVLADGKFYRVGGHVPVSVDVRIIAATHQNLEEHVQQHLFREDLFHRLNVIRIHSPALRERREDIPLLLKHFLSKAAQELNVDMKTIAKEVVEFLQTLAWPGNVRQLENHCRWLMVMATGREIIMDDLPSDLQQQTNFKQKTQQPLDWQQALALWAENQLADGTTDLLHVTTPIYERIMLRAALKQTSGHKKEAARLLGWGRNTLTRKLSELEKA